MSYSFCLTWILGFLPLGQSLFHFSEASNNNESVLFGVFVAVIVLFLLLDLGIFHRKAKKISTTSALIQSIFWVIISCLFGYVIYRFDNNGNNNVEVLEYFSAYLTEKALSVDNIFVILVILKFFQVEERYYYKILVWGILGAIIFRALFIFVGSFFIAKFHWILYLFGVFLIYTGIKIYFERPDKKINPENNIVVKFCRKYLPMSDAPSLGRFMFFDKGKFYFTTLFLVMVLIETTDLIFAVDSIPAAFAITQNEFLIYTSNIFAVMGLRSMFFLLAGILRKFYLLQKGLSIILFFIGIKMLLELFEIEVEVVYYFSLIIVTLTLSIVLSVAFPQKSLAKSNVID